MGVDGDAACGARFISQGWTSLIFSTNGAGNGFGDDQFFVQHTSSPVNQAYAMGGAVSTGVTFGAGGSDTNIDVQIAPKGTGVTKSLGPLRLPSLADSSAPNDSWYYSTTASKAVYKDSGGSVHALY